MNISVPTPSIVVPIGLSGSGKSTLLGKLFPSECIVSPDKYRETLCWGGPPTISLSSSEYWKQMQEVNEGTFILAHANIKALLTHKKVAVMDATNLSDKARTNLEQIATEHNVQLIYLIFNLDVATCIRRDQQRQYPVGTKVIQRQEKLLQRARSQLFGRTNLYYINPDEEVGVTFTTYAPPSHLAEFTISHKKIDVIGDVHGCLQELIDLLDNLGYQVQKSGLYVHPDNRIPVFVGDLIDRGPDSLGVLDFVKQHVDNKLALAIQGNHDNKFLRYLLGRNVQIKHGLEKTIKQISDSFDKQGAINFLSKMKSHLVYVMGGQQFVITHAAFKPEYLGQDSRLVRDYCLYGPSSGLDEEGLPIRINWELTYNNPLSIIYGHTVYEGPHVVQNTYGIDGGVVHGGELICMRLPEKTFAVVSARQQYYIPRRTNGSQKAE